jgi:hypothetical protein
MLDLTFEVPIDILRLSTGNFLPLGGRFPVVFINHLNNKKMKRFITTKLILILKEASQTGVDLDVRVMDKEYDKFAVFLLTDTTLSSNKAAYRNSLIYTRAELAGMTKVSEKKMRQFISIRPSC